MFEAIDNGRDATGSEAEATSQIGWSNWPLAADDVESPHICAIERVMACGHFIEVVQLCTQSPQAGDDGEDALWIRNGLAFLVTSNISYWKV